MAKLTGPFFSLGASGAIAKTLVAFPWKGLNCLRKYVVPANPNTTAQQTQRGYLRTIVDLIHAVQAYGAAGLLAADISAYALYASIYKAAQTWFNGLVKQCLDQKVDVLRYAIYFENIITPGVDSIEFDLHWEKEVLAASNITAVDVYWGTSKTALVNSQAAVVAGSSITGIIAGLTTGTKYYFQFRSTAHNDFDGTRSGIYHAVPL